MREFKTAAKRESGWPNPVDVPLNIDGRDMVATAPPSGVIAIFLANQGDKNKAIVVRSLFELYQQIIPREDYEWIEERMKHGETSVEVLTQVVEYLLEVWGGRPTKSSSDSSTRSVSTGRRSMAKPRSKVATR